MAADLTSRAKLADLTSPEGKAAFEAFLAGARIRSAGDVKALHVLQRPDGWYQSLDFGITAQNLDSLMSSCSSLLLAYAPDQKIPLQPAEDWWQFWTAPLIRGYMRVRCQTHKHSTVFLTVRGGEWQP